MSAALQVILYLAVLSTIALAIFYFFKKNEPEPAGPFNATWRPSEAIVLTIASFVVSILAASFILGFVYAVAGQNNIDSESVLGRFLFILAIESINIYILWQFLKRRQAPLASWGYKVFMWKDVLWAAGAFVAYFMTSTAVSLILPLNYEQQQQLGFSYDQAGANLVMVFFSLVIIPPLAEEFIFRGFLYSGLRSRWPRILAIVVASVLFGLAHLEFGSDQPLHWAAAADTLIMSVFLIGLREKTGGLVAPISMHMIKNGLAFLALFIFHVA